MAGIGLGLVPRVVEIDESFDGTDGALVAASKAGFEDGEGFQRPRFCFGEAL